jgi:hypothetical protein
MAGAAVAPAGALDVTGGDSPPEACSAVVFRIFKPFKNPVPSRVFQAGSAVSASASTGFCFRFPSCWRGWLCAVVVVSGRH